MIAGIVLAAGASERMGRCKALLPILGGTAVDRVLATLADSGCTPVVVVVGRHAAEIRAGARLEGATVVDHPGWRAGRTSSLQAGLRALPPDAQAAVVALVDMPYVGCTTVRALIDTFREGLGAEVVVPVHDGRRGHPVLFARAMFPRLLALGPDESPRALIRAARGLEVATGDAAVLVDLDTPSDLGGRLPAVE